MGEEFRIQNSGAGIKNIFFRACRVRYAFLPIPGADQSICGRMV
jgi:hypothetical protein